MDSKIESQTYRNRVDYWLSVVAGVGGGEMLVKV